MAATLSAARVLLYSGKTTTGMVLLARQGQPSDRFALAGVAAKALQDAIAKGSEVTYLGYIRQAGTRDDSGLHHFSMGNARPVVVQLLDEGSSAYRTALAKYLGYSSNAPLGTDPIIFFFGIQWRSGDVSYPLDQYQNAMVLASESSFSSNDVPDAYPEHMRAWLASRYVMDGAEQSFLGALWDGFTQSPLRFLIPGRLAYEYGPSAVEYLTERAGETVKTVASAQGQIAAKATEGALRGLFGGDDGTIDIPWGKIAIVVGLAGLGVYLVTRTETYKDLSRAKSDVRRAAIGMATKGLIR